MNKNICCVFILLSKLSFKLCLLLNYVNNVKKTQNGGKYHQERQQEAHGPHCSPEEDFYMFLISFYKLAIISPCRRIWLFIYLKQI